MTEHSQRAGEFVADQPRMHWHDQAVWFVRNKREHRAQLRARVGELRSLASQIKAHTLSRLPDYLEEFERNAVPLGLTCTGRATPPSTTASCTGCCASAG